MSIVPKKQWFDFAESSLESWSIGVEGFAPLNVGPIKGGNIWLSI